MTRRRKYDVGNVKKDVPVKAFLFDLVYLDGKDMLEMETEDRLKALEAMKIPKKSELVLSENVEVKDVEQLKGQFVKWTEIGLEGLIAKMKKGGYTPGARNYEWIKMKRSVSKELVDSVDLVALGYYYGSGKRAGFGLGAILGGVYNPDKEQYESVTSIGTGITDQMFQTILERLEKVRAPSQPKNVVVDDVLIPDVWVHPEVVMTVEADSISKAIGKKGKPAGGLSLRFPRLIEFDRDKNPEESTSVKELESMYQISK
jgi:DNA ligase-1